MQEKRFSELPKKLQNKIAQEEADFRSEVMLADCLEQWMAEELTLRGFPSEDITLELSYTQGDGVQFLGEIDMTRFCEYYLDKPETKFLLNEHNPFQLHCVRKPLMPRYTHENTFTVEWNNVCYNINAEDTIEGFDAIDKIIEITQDVDEIRRALSLELKQNGYKYIENFLDPAPILEDLLEQDELYYVVELGDNIVKA